MRAPSPGLRSGRSRSQSTRMEHKSAEWRRHNNTVLGMTRYRRSKRADNRQVKLEGNSHHQKAYTGRGQGPPPWIAVDLCQQSAAVVDLCGCGGYGSRVFTAVYVRGWWRGWCTQHERDRSTTTITRPMQRSNIRRRTPYHAHKNIPLVQYKTPVQYRTPYKKHDTH